MKNVIEYSFRKSQFISSMRLTDMLVSRVVYTMSQGRLLDVFCHVTNYLGM